MINAQFRQEYNDIANERARQSAKNHAMLLRQVSDSNRQSMEFMREWTELRAKDKDHPMRPDLFSNIF